MEYQFLNHETNTYKINLDPRTKILLILMSAVFVLGGAGGNALIWARIVIALIPAVLLLLNKQGKACAIFVLLFVMGCLLQYILLGRTRGFLNIIILASASLLSQFIPGILMGYYAVSTTSVSEFIAAMEKLHIPEQITIPLSVMFRFFPTVGEEASGINDAMSMRGISFGGRHPGRILEYRMVPLMTCSVKIGEELSAASLTRGLGAPVKRTNICKIGFGLFDYAIFLLCIAILAYYIWTKIGGIL